MERVIKLVGMAADICKVWAASTLPIYSYSIFAKTAGVPTPSLTSADKSANSRWIKGYQQYMMNVRQIQITTGRRIMKRLFFPRQARGQSIIRGGAVAVTGFLQARRFVSALIAQVKMAAHATFMKKKIWVVYCRDAHHERPGSNRTPFDKFPCLVHLVFTRSEAWGEFALIPSKKKK